MVVICSSPESSPGGSEWQSLGSVSADELMADLDEADIERLHGIFENLVGLASAGVVAGPLPADELADGLRHVGFGVRTQEELAAFVHFEESLRRGANLGFSDFLLLLRGSVNTSAPQRPLPQPGAAQAGENELWAAPEASLDEEQEAPLGTSSPFVMPTSLLSDDGPDADGEQRSSLAMCDILCQVQARIRSVLELLPGGEVLMMVAEIEDLVVKALQDAGKPSERTRTSNGLTEELARTEKKLRDCEEEVLRLQEKERERPQIGTEMKRERASSFESSIEHLEAECQELTKRLKEEADLRRQAEERAVQQQRLRAATLIWKLGKDKCVAVHHRDELKALRERHAEELQSLQQEAAASGQPSEKLESMAASNIAMQFRQRRSVVLEERLQQELEVSEDECRRVVAENEKLKADVEHLSQIVREMSALEMSRHRPRARTGSSNSNGPAQDGTPRAKRNSDSPDENGESQSSLFSELHDAETRLSWRLRHSLRHSQAPSSPESHCEPSSPTQKVQATLLQMAPLLEKQAALASAFHGFRLACDRCRRFYGKNMFLIRNAHIVDTMASGMERRKLLSSGFAGFRVAIETLHESRKRMALAERVAAAHCYTRLRRRCRNQRPPPEVVATNLHPPAIAANLVVGPAVAVEASEWPL
eukprot:gnl/TRDRNA2_/TRDRNA2_30364_c0_seq1.p1 gnl/TRDRNA2_/TRDRNA2_30364_c0~~gnl/TRDRNA2_/TRDRNA2_30364_c0_seq1.p1  ORF type:complete len:652 (-),score=145.23 gnl/TRDRNA2_/TRDRNA2_30364_c0_seq1:42-1997(-)